MLNFDKLGLVQDRDKESEVSVKLFLGQFDKKTSE